MLGLLTPAGDKIRLSFSEGPYRHLREIMARDGSLALFKSGAMALSAAVSVAVHRCRVSAPEVIIPAYTCPSVPAAVLHAGARPVLVDFSADSLFLDPGRMAAALSQNTVAIVAVHLFGVRQPLGEIRTMADTRGGLVIEDNAQGFPCLTADRGNAADITIMSFSRGKQVSVLGGGAAVLNRGELRDMLQSVPERGMSRAGKRLGLAARVFAYNVLRWPLAFGILERQGFLGIGKTVYKDLCEVAAMDPTTARLLANNLHLRKDAARPAQRSISETLTNIGTEQVSDLARLMAPEQAGALSRYPVLVRSHRDRERLIAEFRSAGIGASRMYVRTLPFVSGVPGVVRDQGPFPNAEAVADRLLTLPVHDGVKKRHVEAMSRILAHAKSD